MSDIGLPPNMDADHAYIQGIADTQDRILGVIDAHIPYLSDDDEALIYERVTRLDEDVTAADYALRTCRCGAWVDGFYEYIDHLKSCLRDAGLINDVGVRLS